MITTEEVERMVTEITLGMDKSKSKVKMTEQASKMWDKIVSEVEEMKSSGYVVDPPKETPDYTTLQ